MTTKKKAAISADKNTLHITNDKEKTKERQLAEVSLSPAVLNGFTARTFAQGAMGEISISDAVSVMKDKVKQVNANDTKALEETLTAQATALDTIFNEMARRAALNMGAHLSAVESYMRLALKAQAQCARTIEIISTMKNPPIVYAKQANISNGNQQVNNGSVNNGHPPTHAEKIINQSNELLSENINATLDSRGTAATIGTDQAMATVEK